MRAVSVRVLGDFVVDGVEARAFGSRKGRLLLQHLALARGRFVSAESLAEALWGTSPPTRPADQVAVLVSRLRHVLGADRIERGDGGYRLHYDWLDADELVELTEEVQRRGDAGNVLGAARAARAALSLIREPMPGAASGTEFAELGRLVHRARRSCASALVGAGAWLEAVGLAEADIEQDPYDEDAVRVLMRANAAGGRVGGASAAFAALRGRLADDLGVDPSPETRDLHTAILRGELRTLPRLDTDDPPALVGRAAELARLDAAARTDTEAARVVVIEGEAGIGKTSVLGVWSARRVARGDLVLRGTCGRLDRALPLDALLAAIAAYVRSLEPAVAAHVLGLDTALLGPLLGLAPGANDRDPAPDHLPPSLAEGVAGPSRLYGALTSVIARAAGSRHVVLVLDDAHLAGSALVEWLRFLRRRATVGLLVVAAVRPGEGDPLPATETIEIGVLDRAATIDMVGADRADELYERTLGHPLFLAELAADDTGASIPASLVDAVTTRCDELGAAADTVRAAAVLGPRIDLDLLAAVQRRPVLDVLVEVELAVRRRLLVEQDGVFVFRHELVRTALEAASSAGRAALLHREASRALALRPDTDPIQVAHHARLGGDLRVAAEALRSAAMRASERFDHATAERLLDEALRLHPDGVGRLARARVRTRRRDYRGALADLEGVQGAEPLEVGAWACYFDRRFDRAVRYADDGALAAEDPRMRARCQIVGGRTRHAAGDLAGAEELLTDALTTASGPDRVTASAWLGVVRAHQSRIDDALPLLSAATTAHAGVEHTSAMLHALLFTGHVHALAGRPRPALEAFTRYTTEVERRQVPRFAGRGVNFTGWVLRSLGEPEKGVEAHLEALEIAEREGTTAELRVAALEDLAEDRLLDGDLDGATDRLDEAESALGGDLVFGWRLEMKLRSHRARLALCGGQPERARTLADGLARDAEALEVPRYAALARLLAQAARAASAMPVDLSAAEADLDVLDRVVGIEAWWWTGEVAVWLGVPAWRDRAADRAERLARAAGPELADGLCRHAARRLDRWTAELRAGQVSAR